MPDKTNAQQEAEWSNEVNRGRTHIHWQFPEYDKPDRGTFWYVMVIGLGVLLLWYAISDGNFLFALILLLFALILFTHHRTDPLDITFAVHDTGITVGDRFFRFREIESFSVIYEPPDVKRLYIVPKNAILRREISIPLLEQNPLRVRSVLLDFVTEDLERDEESQTDLITRVFKI